MIGPTLLRTTFSAHRFIFYPFTATDGSLGNTAGRVKSPRSIMVHHCFRSKEVRRARKQNIDYGKQHYTPHCWLPSKVMYPENSTKRFSWLTRSTPFFIIAANYFARNYLQALSVQWLFHRCNK